MRILTDVPDRMLLEERPLALALGIGGGLAALAAAGASSANGLEELPATLTGVIVLAAGMSIALERASLALDRSDGLVRIERVGVLGVRSFARELHYLREADVETAHDENGNPTRHRLVLRFAGGHAEPACRAFTPGEGAQHAAEAVNRWLYRMRWERRAG